MNPHDCTSQQRVSPTIVRHINQSATRRDIRVLVILRVRVRQRQQVVVDLDAPDHRRTHRREVGGERENEVVLSLNPHPTPHRRVLVPQRAHDLGRRLQVVHVAAQRLVVDQVVLGNLVHSAGDLVLSVIKDH